MASTISQLERKLDYALARFAHRAATPHRHASSVTRRRMRAVRRIPTPYAIRYAQPQFIVGATHASPIGSVGLHAALLKSVPSCSSPFDAVVRGVP